VASAVLALCAGVVLLGEIVLEADGTPRCSSDRAELLEQMNAVALDLAGAAMVLAVAAWIEAFARTRTGRLLAVGGAAFAGIVAFGAFGGFEWFIITP
jgi:hypothetical protein